MRVEKWGSPMSGDENWWALRAAQINFKWRQSNRVTINLSGQSAPQVRERTEKVQGCKTGPEFFFFFFLGVNYNNLPQDFREWQSPLPKKILKKWQSIPKHKIWTNNVNSCLNFSMDEPVPCLNTTFLFYTWFIDEISILSLV